MIESLPNPIIQGREGRLHTQTTQTHEISGLTDDAIIAVLAAAGSNVHKMLGLLRRKVGRFVFALCDRVVQSVFMLIQRHRNLIAWW